MEAMHVYKEVLTLDKSCTDAAQELMKVQILQLMVSAGVSANEGMSVIWLCGVFIYLFTVYFIST